MCGIAGFRGFNKHSELVLQRMGNAIMHRGPDTSGVWSDLSSGVGLAHQRLSILDLSSAGSQPMISSTGRYIMSFNGEIYNHKEMRKSIDFTRIDFSWKGRSDTETILTYIEIFGFESALKKMVGMFAIALWDRQERSLILARDRFGEKPLYYGIQGQGSEKSLIFGSELNALKAHPSFNSTIDRGALSLYLRHSYIPEPYSIYKGVNKLPAGHFLEFKENNFKKMTLPKTCSYWSLSQAAISGNNNQWQGTENEAVEHLDLLLNNTISKQMVSDVSLGAFLSGGIDSSTVVSIMQAQSTKPVKTFTIGFNEQDFNEAHYAKAVATHLGTDHNELYVSANETLAVIPKLAAIYDEPFSDSSQIPTFLVSQLAKQKVKVSLSGDGGDEIFCGYNRYKMSNDYWKKMNLIPRPLRLLASNILTSISPNQWNRLSNLVPGKSKLPNFGDKFHKGLSVLDSRTIEDLYLGFVSYWNDPADIIINGKEPPTNLRGNRPDLIGLDAIQEMMVLDSLTYLPDDILVKVDRAAMGVSLETRIPFLDHNIFEFAWQLPQNLKLRDGKSKWVLRQVLGNYLPMELIERPKMGFGVPIDSWLRGPLREWAESLLDESRIASEGFFNPVPIRKKWTEHLSGERNWQNQIWNILIFQAWLEEQLC